MYFMNRIQYQNPNTKSKLSFAKCIFASSTIPELINKLLERFFSFVWDIRKVVVE
jgi:hypothetical protein